MIWRFKGRSIEDISEFGEDAVGFIYEVSFTNGMKYLGRKALYHNFTRPPLKGYKRKRKGVRESDWKKYIGSPKDAELLESLKSGEIKVSSKEILHICFSNWEMTYYETKFLFEKDCILADNYYNNNILGKFYRPKTE